VNGKPLKQDGIDFNPDADDSGEGKMMPIGIGAEDGSDEVIGDDLFDSGHDGTKRSLNSSALLLAVVVIVAIAGLFSMRTITRASAATDLPNEVEQSIETFLSILQSSQHGGRADGSRSLMADKPGVLEVLNESYVSRQVSLEDVQRNPFIIFEEPANGAAPSPMRPVGADPMIQKRADKRALFQQAAGRLELTSVLMGSTPLATINRNIVQVGATVIAEPEGVPFRVVTITSDYVVVAAEDRELDVKHEATLTIDRERARRSTPQRSQPRGPVRPR
jgi:hypothetical protein